MKTLFWCFYAVTVCLLSCASTTTSDRRHAVLRNISFVYTFVTFFGRRCCYYYCCVCLVFFVGIRASYFFSKKKLLFFVWSMHTPHTIKLKHHIDQLRFDHQLKQNERELVTCGFELSFRIQFDFHGLHTQFKSKNLFKTTKKESKTFGINNEQALKRKDSFKRGRNT